MKTNYGKINIYKLAKLKKLEWLKEDQRLFLSRGYLKEGVEPEQRYDVICEAIETYGLKLATTKEGIEYIKGISNRFRKYISNGWVSFSTPVLTNFGEEDNLPISCNVSTLDDSLDDIYKGIHELGMLAKYGAGTSQNFSALRPIGSDISTGGITNSIIDWVELYADMMNKTRQNSARRGFLTAYLSLDHPEIMEFLDIGTHRLHKDRQIFLQTITTGVTIPVGWRKGLIEGDKDKRKIWSKLLKTRQEAGYPYIFDLENANENKPQVYKDKDMFIGSSNICCVTGETLILTDKGNIPIIDTIGKEVNVWNGEEWSQVVPFKTSDESEIFQVKMKSGEELNVTKDHTFYVLRSGEVIKTTTEGLHLGESLMPFKLPDREEFITTEVVSVKMKKEKEPTYCFTEPKKGLGVFNNILTGQCEISEFSSPDKTFACCLSSVNAYYFDDWKDDPHFIFDMTIMLDCVIEEYIEKGEHLPGLEKSIKFAREHRAVGLGILGFHSYLQKKNIVFGELASYSVNNNIFKKLHDDSLRASEWMAVNFGEPEILKGYGLRNTTRLAQAPTKSCTPPYTKFLDENNISIDYYELCERGGVDLEELLKVTIETDSGGVKYSWGENIQVKRDGKVIETLAYLIKEGDEIL